MQLKNFLVNFPKNILKFIWQVKGIKNRESNSDHERNHSISRFMATLIMTV